MESSHEQRLRLVDINQLTVKQTWPHLLDAVQRAHFISVDLELSGLGLHLTRGTYVADEKYKLLRKVANLYAIVSMGVACFQWQPGATSLGAIPCKAEVFNIWLLSQRPYTIDPLSAKFLLKHGFDFNKQLLHGLPYDPVGVASEAGGVRAASGASEHYLVELFQLLMLSSAPLVVHNGWVDLLFLYHTCHAPLPPTRDSLIADLAEMLERGGVYDTKAIARYHYSEERTFLEYIYKKALVRNQRQQWVWLNLVTTSYPTLTSSVTEDVLLPRIPDILISDLMSINVCPNFRRHGSCSAVDCGRSHDVTVAVLQEEHTRDVQRLKRKRKRARQKGRPGESSPPPAGPTHMDHPLSELFKHELAVAKVNLSSCDPAKHSCDSVKESCDLDRSCGHRAGFDAFMTGFTFACFALNSCPQLNAHSTHTLNAHSTHSKTGQDNPHTSTTPTDHLPTDELHTASPESCAEPPPLSPSQLLEGLSDMKNCLSNRGQPVPVRIAYSQFSKCSQGHRSSWKRLTQDGPTDSRERL